ncbi:MAG: C69 family dipeptidase, partial [Muribaculaceae bacterium]|nr:C69 family dipeptidase [Muribaculaceae bacterium]
MTTKKLIFTATILAGAISNALACTSLIAGKNATTDGSVMITYAADSHVRFGFLENQPAADHKPGEMRQIIEWTSNKPLGQIPE